MFFFGKKNKDIRVNEFIDEAKNLEGDFKKILKDLVGFKSVLDKFNPDSQTPFGTGAKDALCYMLELGKKDGFKTFNQDNYAGHIEFGKGKETLGILAHLDVVPAIGNWSHDPFDMVERDGKLFGRGVNDDKGPLVASYLALRMLKEKNIKPKKKIKLIMGCDEESGSRCLTHYFKYNPMPQVGFSPDACYPVIHGEKAHAHFDIVGTLPEDSIIKELYSGERYNIVPDEAYMKLKKDLSKEYLEFLKNHNYKGEVKDGLYKAYGVSAHAMTPEKGLNAAFILFEFLNNYSDDKIVKIMNDYVTFDPFGKKMGIDVHHEEMMDLTVNVGIFRISDGQFKIGFDSRVPLNSHEIVIRERLNQILKDTGYTYDFPPMSPVHYVPKNSKLVQTLLTSYKEVTGDNTNDAYTIGGGTYAQFIENAVAFGPQFPGRPDVDHQVDEYIYIDDYIKSIAIYAKAIFDLVK
jgi:succinyl-diaminopimelate desuccinylase